jgi:hypothetical protein
MAILPLREGLSSRGAASDHVQIHVDKGFDFDSEVEMLRAHVGRIKQASIAKPLVEFIQFHCELGLEHRTAPNRQRRPDKVIRPTTDPNASHPIIQ